MDPLEKVTLDKPENFTYVSFHLSNEERDQLQLVLLNNIDVFAWSHFDMVGINSTVCNASTIPENFYNKFIIYSGYELSQIWVIFEKLINCECEKKM